MKHKTKQLRSYLQAKNIPTNMCKEKQELADLILRSNNLNRNTSSNNRPPPFSNQQQPSTSNSHQPRNFNDKITEFMNGVHNFVNYNINAASSGSTSNSPTRRSSRTTTTTTVNNNDHTTTTNSTNNNQSGFSTNMNDILNFIGDQIPPVVQQTFTNNRFTFNNIFNTPNTAEATTNNSRTQQTASNNYESSNETENEQRSTASSTTQENAGSNIKRRASISELTQEEDINILTVRQMKEILASNFVDFKGVCERNELIERVKTLFKSHVQNKLLTEEINQQSVNKDEATNGEGKKTTEDDLCKICMDAIVDCVLLDCGHMVSCTKCGKRLAECPICRKNIIKVVRVFKS